jgi:RNA polymerase sigma-70 factor, ECF subfamily
MDSASSRQDRGVEHVGDAAEPKPADRARFRALFEKELSYVWTSLRRLGIAEREREDLANEVFFRVYRRIDEYDEARPIRPWLFAFAVRVAAQHRRRAQSRLERLGDDTDVADLAAAPRDESGSADAELVYRALDTIGMERRAVLVLHDLDGHTAPEIAAALSIPEGTVYSRLRAARADFTAAVRRLTRSER